MWHLIPLPSLANPHAGAPAVKWDAGLAKDAQDAVNTCQVGGNQNLGWQTWFWSASWGSRPRFGATDANAYWAKGADAHKNGGGSNTDSFAIGVWKNQEAVGCAWKANCKRGDWNGPTMTWLCEWRRGAEGDEHERELTHPRPLRQPVGRLRRQRQAERRPLQGLSTQACSMDNAWT